MSEYYRQAPKLYHLGYKDNSDFYLLPKNLMDPIFNQLNGKQGNQVKLMAVLIGTKGDGSFAVSEKWICDRTGMNQSNYIRARKALIDRGWLKLENRKLYVDFNAICKSPDNSADMSSEQGTCADNMLETCTESMHNKETKNNKIINNFNLEGYQNTVNDPLLESETTGDHKEDFAWIDEALRGEEYMRLRAVEMEMEERKKEQQDDTFDLDSIFEGMFEVEVVDSSYNELDEIRLWEEPEEHMEWEEDIP